MDRIVVLALSQTDWLALFDVTISGTCPGRFDPDSHQLTCFLGCVGSQSQRFLKSHLVRNDMIGGENEHRGGVIASNDPTTPERDGSSGVAIGGCGDDV